VYVYIDIHIYTRGEVHDTYPWYYLLQWSSPAKKQLAVMRLRDVP